MKKKLHYWKPSFSNAKDEPDLKPLCDMAISNLSNIDTAFKNGTIEEKGVLLVRCSPKK
ncbi:hypothetical protein [Taibaiella lutea]|uniref:hypothetical protein n=1 Tax=Taibaiella lutea TaxID=2608001 RepID=UPI00167FDF03|nr:hypothetical protein [Taibaiella lutea]